MSDRRTEEIKAKFSRLYLEELPWECELDNDDIKYLIEAHDWFREEVERLQAELRHLGDEANWLYDNEYAVWVWNNVTGPDTEAKEIAHDALLASLARQMGRFPLAKDDASRAARALRSIPSEARTAASRENGKKGGRPRKQTAK